MRNPDLISPLDFLSRLPKQLPNLPRRLLGLYYARIGNRDKTLSLAWALQRAADKYPQRPALIDEQRSLSYAGLNRWSNRIAAALKVDGVHAGTVVAVMLENRIELLAVLAAVSKLGAISALINTTQRGKVLAHSINLVKPGYMVVGEELVSSITDAEPLLEKSSLVRYWIADQDCLQDTGTAPHGWLNLLQQAQGQPEHNPLESYGVKMKDPCFFIYTSGTTGMPKASIMSHGKWIKAYGGFGHSGLALNSRDVLYLTLPCYHNNAVTVCWGAAIAGGAAIALRRGFSASAFWSDVQRYQATCFAYIGELCRYLLNQPECPEEKNNSLRSMIGNGLRPAIWQAFKNRFEIEQVTEFYASSEGNIGFTNVFNFDNTVGFSPATFAIVKYDLENDRVVRNAKGFLQKTKRDVPGLLISEISDKWPFDGYTDAQKSETAILRNVFKKGDAWYNSGDLMRDIGCKHAQFVDRLGDTFRWKGENVSTTEVESTLSTFPGIEDAVVYGVEINGTNGRCGMAALRLAPESDFDGEALARYLDAELPSYAAPLFIRLLDQVETTGTFKYKKTDLKNAGYDPRHVQDPLFARLPGSNSFTPVTPELYQALTSEQYRF
ncbi:long-chain-acyl-CoA synthetase [Pseudomonas segetis]|uniref:Citronellyl-CoA synthetase n=1 Tax=Pseudomonas segetis TaxID=298908 RepID=A0A239HY07_9PSED|nr:long-chain-acyl-CoA synthetase [Pseudomonas segetis]SNS86336.1 citronellyl-CoA synthetase [Pseudomonas segetis]